MSSTEHPLIALGQLALEYYRAKQATTKAEARLDKAEDALRRTTEQNPNNFNVRNLYNYREELVNLKQLHEEVKAAQRNEHRSKTKLFKAAKEVA